jgi:hypothetical protein
VNVVAFIQKWTASTRTERAASQEHFIDLCRLLGEPTPNEADPHGEFYLSPLNGSTPARLCGPNYVPTPGVLSPCGPGFDE